MTHTIELGPKDFLTSDLHIGGAPWPYKLWFNKKKDPPPYQQMKESAAKVWDYQVSSESTILIVGDAIDLWAEDVEEELEWYRQRPGRKLLVPGNHDAPHPMNEAKSSAGWTDVFEVLPAQSTVLKFGEMVERIPVCHYPNSERQQGRWRHERSLGSLPVLHGHTHSRKAVSRTAEGVLQINVGWPSWRRLVAAQEIDELLQEPWEI